MEIAIILIILVVIIAPIVALWKAWSAGAQVLELQEQVHRLDAELNKLRRQISETPKPAAPVPSPSPESAVVPEPKPAIITPQQVHLPTPPPLPVLAAPAAIPITQPVRTQPAPAPLPVSTPATITATAPKPKPAFDWEQFMGVKLFAWLGGLIIFLGIAFAIKYSFEKGLISPELRAAGGFLIGLGFLVGGVLLKRKAYTVTSQTLCATGTLILYAITFACRAVYKFPLFGPGPTMVVMVLITTTAFLLAVRLNAMVVAVLGLLGGFLTPLLLSTGQDNPVGLFGYIALLNLGLLAVSSNKRWDYLTALAAGGTVLLQVGWAGKFFEANRYFEGSKILVPFAVLAGFFFLYLIALGWTKKQKRENTWLTGACLMLGSVALLFGFYFLGFAPLGERPLWLFGFLFLIDLGFLAVVMLDRRMASVYPIAGLALFIALALWNADFLTTERLLVALGLYFALAVLHALVPLVLQRRKWMSTPSAWSQSFAPLALVLALMPIFKLTTLPFLIWPFVLLIDVLAIGIAVLTVSLWSVLAVLLLTLITLGATLCKTPATLTGLPVSMFLIAGFAVFFAGSGLWLARRLLPAGGNKNEWLSKLGEGDPNELVKQLPAFAVVLPYLLLILVILQLPLADPSSVFGLALLLTVLSLGLSRLLRNDTLPAISLAALLAIEHAWQFNRFTVNHAATTLGWYVVFNFLVLLFPFVFRRTFANRTAPWITAALSGPLHFFLVHRLVSAAYPNPFMGALPAVFAIPSLLALVFLLRQLPPTAEQRNTLLAWFGGVTLFFITLIFPIQFDRQWITLGWALEGAALCWLYHRIPHRGLPVTGVGLLVVSFVRLAMNPAVLEYHNRSATPIFNWYLYTYGCVAVCLFVAARLLAPPRDRVTSLPAPALLATLGTVLAFLLVNIQIADYFTEPGSRSLIFQFSGNFARDMSYSIAWALFSIVLLIVGIRRKLSLVRYASIALLGVTLLKLFFHDLARLNQLYRIGALIAVGIIAMLASVLYQRFLATEKTPDENHAPPDQAS